MATSRIVPLVAVVGETSSGKSSLALDLALQFRGEIICADARTLYEGMDIGTAKPTQSDRERVRHHLLDVALPTHQISAAEFQKLAYGAIADITSRGKLPILAGGSGLYIDSALFDYRFGTAPNAALRQRLNGLSVDELQGIIRRQGLPMPGNTQNPRHLMRAIEAGAVIDADRSTMRPNTLVLGLVGGNRQQRISRRVDDMLALGLEDEARQLFSTYNTSKVLNATIGYKEFVPYFAGLSTIEDVRAQIIKNTLAYAKRQRTWFRRNKSVHWLGDRDEAVDLITAFLNT